MKRKVVQHGPATLIISLPSEWVKKFEVMKGDELNVVQEDNTLVISTEVRRKSMDTQLDISDLDRTSIMYIVRGMYRLGYDKVRLAFKNPMTRYQRQKEDMSVLSIIHQEVNRLVGYEVIQESENMCTIKDIQETSGKDFEQILRRIFLLIIDASKNLRDGAKDNNLIILESIEKQHDTITKFVSYCMRLLNKKSYPTPRKTSYYYHIIAILDRITDIIKYASRDLRAYNKKVSFKTNDIISATHENLYTFYSFFYKYDLDQIRGMNDARYATEQKLRKLTEDPKEIIVATNIFHIMEILLDLVEARSALEY